MLFYLSNKKLLRIIVIIIFIISLSDSVYYEGSYAENPNKQNYNSKQVIC